MRLRKDGQPDRRCTKAGPGMTPEEFWAMASPIPVTGCWIFLNSADTNPYGTARVEGVSDRTAHRIAYRLATGRTIPWNRVVMHTCDVKGCVNPAHLVVGTARRNSLDAWKRVFTPGMKARRARKMSRTMRAVWRDPSYRRLRAALREAAQ